MYILYHLTYIQFQIICVLPVTGVTVEIGTMQNQNQDTKKTNK